MQQPPPIKEFLLDSGSVHDLSRGKGDTLVSDSAVIELKPDKAPTAERLEEWRVFAQKCCDAVEDRVRQATSACMPQCLPPSSSHAMLPCFGR
jgi:hypothetical protein